ncbi:MAG TPA: hypothetical protein VF159_07660 [Gemmatimonadaceae bacterium]
MKIPADAEPFVWPRKDAVISPATDPYWTACIVARALARARITLAL